MPYTHTEENTYFLKYTYNWVSPLMRRGKEAIQSRTLLNQQDLLALPKCLLSSCNQDKFNSEWALELENVKENTHNGNANKPSMLRVFYNSFKSLIQVLIGLRIIGDLISVSIPFILRELVIWIDLYVQGGSNRPAIYMGIVWGILLVSVQFISTQFQNISFFLSSKLFLRIISMLTTAIYNKSMKLPANHGHSGNIITLHSTDTINLSNTSAFFNFMFSFPLLIIAAQAALFVMIGYTSFISPAIFLLILFAQSFLSKRVFQKRKLLKKGSENRISKIYETLSNIRIVKYMGWEEQFIKDIAYLRECEIKHLPAYFSIKVLLLSFIPLTPLLISFIVFAVYYALGNPIIPSVVFPVISIINIMRAPIALLPVAIVNMSNSLASLNRIQNFLLYPEHISYIQPISTSGLSHNNAVAMKNVDIHAISDTNERITLVNNVSVTIPQDKLTIIIGSTGSGKSSLINCIAGEALVGDKQVVHRSSNISFVPQVSWIFNGTVKQNIVMDKEYMEEKYIKVLNLCQLMNDLSNLVGGDQTEIGSGGVNLSGGQKQRISLARALYSESSLSLLDDPLSAVDATVRVALFEDVILGAMKGTTRILVTNFTELLPNADHIIFVNDKNVEFCGSVDEYFSLYTKTVNISNKHVENKNCTYMQHITNAMELSQFKSTHQEVLPTLKRNGNLIETEKDEIGVISNKIYKWYISKGGIHYAVLTLFLYAVWRAIGLFSDTILSYWAYRTSIFYYSFTSHQYFILFTIAVSLTVITTFIRSIPIIFFSLNISHCVHHKLVSRILHAPLRFFDINPVGRIINRLAGNMETMTIEMIDNILIAIQTFFITFSSIILGCISIPLFILIVVIVLVVYFFLVRYVNYTNRAVKRLESTTRSPLIATMSESLEGLTFLRTCGLISTFKEQHLKQLDNVLQITNCSNNIRRWLSFRIDLINFILNFSVICFIVLMLYIHRSNIQPASSSLYSLTVTLIIATSSIIGFLTSLFSQIEADFSVVERIHEYINTVPQEMSILPTHKRDSFIDIEWPQSGTIEVKDICVRYGKDLPLVLNNLSFTISSGNKIGIVGRTGSGKSTLILCLLRLLELESGNISFDGLDTASVPIHTLREKITVLPQDPILFQGTIRTNMDPFNIYGDDKIIYALRTVRMLSVLEERLKIGSSTLIEMNIPMEDSNINISSICNIEVEQNGNNFSVGERQLLCLARAIMKKSKILLLDEATASIDLKIDEMIQKILRVEFKDCTIITIAHRLSTIMDYDKILVLNNGILCEYNAPNILLEDKQSLFYSMVMSLNESDN